MKTFHNIETLDFFYNFIYFFHINQIVFITFHVIVVPKSTIDTQSAHDTDSGQHPENKDINGPSTGQNLTSIIYFY